MYVVSWCSSASDNEVRIEVSDMIALEHYIPSSEKPFSHRNQGDNIIQIVIFFPLSQILLLLRILSFSLASTSSSHSEQVDQIQNP